MAGTPASSRGGTGIAESLLDAKGDLIVASAADTAARLAVGVDGQALVADSAQAAGVKWGYVPIYVVKPADETINTSAVLQNDDALLFAISASVTLYVHFELYLWVVGANTTMDAKLAWTTPAGATILWAPQSNNLGTTDGTWGRREAAVAGNPPVAGGTVITVGTGASTNIFVIFAGYVFGGGTAGNVQLQWAQNTSDAGNLTVKQGSYLRYLTLIA